MKRSFYYEKIIALLLVLCITSSVCSSALAASSTVDSNQPISADLSGQVLVSTEFQGVKKAENGLYAVEYEDATLPVGRLDISLSSAAEVEDALANDDLTDEIKDYIKEKYQQALETNSQSATVTVFSAELLPDQLTRSSNSIYYTYNGHEMRSDRVFASGVSTDWQRIVSGSGTSIEAEIIRQVLVAALGMVSKTIGILSTGQAIISAVNSQNIYGCAEDYLSMRLLYNDNSQWTYAKVGSSWQLGLVSQQVTITKIGCEQHYFNPSTNSGKTTMSDRYVQEMYSTAHFNSPWATAWQWVTAPQTEYITWKVGGKTFYF